MQDSKCDECKKGVWTFILRGIIELTFASNRYISMYIMYNVSSFFLIFIFTVWTIFRHTKLKRTAYRMSFVDYYQSSVWEIYYLLIMDTGHRTEISSHSMSTWNVQWCYQTNMLNEFHTQIRNIMLRIRNMHMDFRIFGTLLLLRTFKNDVNAWIVLAVIAAEF